MTSIQLSRKGFTLVELLVVVTIITLLIAILLPSLGKAKQQSSTAQCASKLHGIGQAYRTYLADWNGITAPNGLMFPKANVPDMYRNNTSMAAWAVADRNKWRLEYGGLWPYMGGVTLDPSITGPLPQTPPNMAKRYVCDIDFPTGMIRTSPAASDPPLILVDTGPGNPAQVTQQVGSPGYWSYSVNSVLNTMGRFRNRFQDGQGNGIPLPWSDPLKEVSLTHTNSSQFICFIEEANDSLFNDEVMDAPAYSNDLATNGGDRLTDRHNFGGNVGFMDGHVDYYKATVFNYQPSAISGTYVDHATAMQSAITRMFFPDGGTFASP